MVWAKEEGSWRDLEICVRPKSGGGGGGDLLPPLPCLESGGGASAALAPPPCSYAHGNVRQRSSKFNMAKRLTDFYNQLRTTVPNEMCNTLVSTQICM